MADQPTGVRGVTSRFTCKTADCDLKGVTMEVVPTTVQLIDPRPSGGLSYKSRHGWAAPSTVQCPSCEVAWEVKHG